MCPWYDYDLDWQDDFIPCDWAKDTRPRSAFNNGYDGDTEFVVVELYRDTDYRDRDGCVPANTKVDFAGEGPRIRSHKWAPAC